MTLEEHKKPISIEPKNHDRLVEFLLIGHITVCIAFFSYIMWVTFA